MTNQELSINNQQSLSIVGQLTPWWQLRKGTISCEQALELLIDKNRDVDLSLLDQEVKERFVQQIRSSFKHHDHDQPLPHVIPLLLWRNCFYLGCPISISSSEIKSISDRLGTEIKIVEISEKSYLEWYRVQNLDTSTIDASVLINPLTGEIETENISETAQLYLSQAGDQIDRIKTIISSALRNRASDIHLEPTLDGLRIRYRIDGILRHITTLPLEVSRKVIISLKVMCEMDIAESRVPQDGRIGQIYTTGEQKKQTLDMRVSTLPCVASFQGEPSEKAVIRLLKRQDSFEEIKDLGFSETTRRIYEDWLVQPQGMIIFTGPTGSGKTSTLYTSLKQLAHESVNVVTVEDPAEYVLPGITQTQVNELAGMTFATGLKAILRQDPDIIMVGEIRDHETAETAVRAALTGHLVLTTLHTNDAIGAIPRLKDIGPDPGLISDALLGVVAQRLVRKVCPYCAVKYEPNSADLEILGLTEPEANLNSWRKGMGCEKCLNSGYLGREALVELLNIDYNTRPFIYEKSTAELRKYLLTTNFYSFRLAAIEKVIQGITTVEEIRRVLPQTVLNQEVF